MEKNIEFKSVEPLKSNRFLITLEGVNIPQFLFRDYKLYNEGEDLIFETSFYETVDYIFNPKEFFNIISVELDYLSPIGDVVNGLKFDVKGSNFKRKQSYKKDDLQITKLRFVIDTNTITPKFIINDSKEESAIVSFKEREITEKKNKKSNGK